MSMFPKNKRIVDRGLLDYVKTLPCCICGERKNIDPSHLTSRGAGGSDTFNNVIPLCRKHHMEMHRNGMFYMIDNYINFHVRLIDIERHDILSKYEYHQICKHKEL